MIGGVLLRTEASDGQFAADRTDHFETARKGSFVSLWAGDLEIKLSGERLSVIRLQVEDEAFPF